MRIGLLAVDSQYPNLALMKLSAYHKAEGDSVEWYNPIERYDRVYMAKVFTFTPDYGYYVNADKLERGGTGYDIRKVLPPEIDRLQPDYSLYPRIDGKTAYGFLTRGLSESLQMVRGAEEGGRDNAVHGRGGDRHRGKEQPHPHGQQRARLRLRFVAD